MGGDASLISVWCSKCSLTVSNEFTRLLLLAISVLRLLADVSMRTSRDSKSLTHIWLPGGRLLLGIALSYQRGNCKLRKCVANPNLCEVGERLTRPHRIEISKGSTNPVRVEIRKGNARS